MTELTKEKLIEEAKLKIAIAKCYPNSGMARVEGELFKIALASLEAEPIGAFHIVEQQVDGTSYYIKDGEWPIDTGIIEVYAASPMTVVLNDVSGPLALAYKELTPAIMRNHIAVFERYGITPNDSITTIHALRIALDGIERSDAMLQGKGGDMAIAASYTMHLYCDCRQCTNGKYQTPDFGEYIGTSWAGCAKEARKDGWRISKDKTRAFAPGHKILRSNKGE